MLKDPFFFSTKVLFAAVVAVVVGREPVGLYNGDTGVEEAEEALEEAESVLHASETHIDESNSDPYRYAT